MARQVVTFHYELKGDKGEVLDSSQGGDPLIFLEGAEQIIPGLEKSLVGLQKGSKSQVTVPCEEAYGVYDDTLVGSIPRSQFPAGPMKVGDVFQSEKDGRAHVLKVIDINDETVTVDANHPMAGKNLHFSVEIVDRRDASPEEIAHGHVHHHGHSH